MLQQNFDVAAEFYLLLPLLPHPVLSSEVIQF
jgi:hypothetical protein